MADSITTEMVSFARNGETVDGYLARPEGQGPFPGVIVVQEWWGLDAHIQDVAQRFAREGFAALAPDLYHGKVTKEPSEAQKLMMALDMNRAARIWSREQTGWQANRSPVAAGLAPSVSAWAGASP